MARKESFKTSLFLYEEGRTTKITNTLGMGFVVGIWWHDHIRLVAFVQPITDVDEAGNLIDSDLTHDSTWTLARNELQCSLKTEYFKIARGRIMWDATHQSGVIYHGNSTPQKVLADLARIYRLPRWQHRLDEHYLTGDALEAYYGIE